MTTELKIKNNKSAFQISQAKSNNLPRERFSKKIILAFTTIIVYNNYSWIEISAVKVPNIGIVCFSGELMALFLLL